MQFLSLVEEYSLHYQNFLSNSLDLMKNLSAALSAKNGHLALLEDIRHGWLALSRGSSNHHLHATTPMSSLANGFTSRLSNVSLLKMMKTSLSAMHRGRKSIPVHCSNIFCLFDLTFRVFGCVAYLHAHWSCYMQMMVWGVMRQPRWAV